jgi:hypothetical protein
MKSVEATPVHSHHFETNEADVLSDDSESTILNCIEKWRFQNLEI